MKKQETARLYEERLALTKRKHEHLARQKQAFVTDVYRIRTHPKLSTQRRAYALQSYLRGRSYEDWVSYYDDHLETLASEASEYRRLAHENTVPEPSPYLAPAAIVVLALVLTASVFVLGPGLTSFAVVEQPTTHVIPPSNEKATIIEVPPLNISEINESSVVDAQR